jgi:hypothetical protein
MKRKISRSVILSLAFVLLLTLIVRSAVAQTSSDEEVHAPLVSMVNLLSGPPRGKPTLVQVSGYLRLDFEGEAPYLHKEDYEKG